MTRGAKQEQQLHQDPTQHTTRPKRMKIRQQILHFTVLVTANSIGNPTMRELSHVEEPAINT
eukprot:6097559-Amphidinium_carterae.1